MQPEPNSGQLLVLVTCGRGNPTEDPEDCHFGVLFSSHGMELIEIMHDIEPDETGECRCLVCWMGRVGIDSEEAGEWMAMVMRMTNEIEPEEVIHRLMTDRLYGKFSLN